MLDNLTRREFIHHVVRGVVVGAAVEGATILTDFPNTTNNADAEPVPEKHNPQKSDYNVLAYTSIYSSFHSDIKIIDINTLRQRNLTNPQNLTNRITLNREPDWSNDGRLAFVAFSPTADSSKIFIMNDLMKADGPYIRELPNNLNDCSTPVWSPNSKKIAYYSVDVHTYLPNVYIQSLYASPPIKISGSYHEKEPKWSPDGTKLAFISLEKGTKPVIDKWYLAIANSDGKNMKRVTGSFDLISDFDWAPDGKRIVFTAAEDGLSSQLFIIDTNYLGLQKLTWVGSNNSPRWSPDGKNIVFCSLSIDNSGAMSSIYSMEIKKSNLKRLTNGPGYDTSPAWSPDGEKIAYASRYENYSWIHIMNNGGLHNKALTNDKYHNINPLWAPFPLG